MYCKPTHYCKLSGRKFQTISAFPGQKINFFACRSSAHLQKWLAAHSNRRTERRLVAPRKCFESESPARRGITRFKGDSLLLEWTYATKGRVAAYSFCEMR